MELGMIGLGRMGGNMTQRLLGGGHHIVAYDPNEQARLSVVNAGAIEATSINELVSHLSPPRAVWVMVPAGDVTDETIDTLSVELSVGDTIIDGGNLQL